MCGSDVWSETKRSKGAALAEGKPIGLVSVAVVAYNEASCIGTLFEDIEAQDFPHDRMEIVLVDSASTDDTKAVMRAFAARHEEVEGARQGEGGNAASSQPFARVVLCDNPARILPAGWNVAIGEFHGDVLMRIDAHARIPADFVANNVRVLEEGEFVCGGPRPTAAHPSTPWSETLLLAEDSAFGSSIADYRKGGGKRYVSSAFHAAFRREVLERVGPYDERLVRTEDNDYFYRVREAGYRIRFDEYIRSKQYARSRLRHAQAYGAPEVRERVLDRPHAACLAALRVVFSPSASGLRSSASAGRACWRDLLVDPPRCPGCALLGGRFGCVGYRSDRQSQALCAYGAAPGDISAHTCALRRGHVVGRVQGADALALGRRARGLLLVRGGRFALGFSRIAAAGAGIALD